MRSSERFALGGDLPVRRIGFGAMRITGRGIWGEPPDPEAARAVLRRAVELGVDLIDTADSYGPGVSETLIAEALHPYPNGLVISTKGGFIRSGPWRLHPNCRPEHLREACEGSLRRLRLEQIDLYQLHTVDSRVPFEESVGALAELRQEGKIRHVGLSNVGAEQVARARAIVPVVSVQNRYNLADRAEDATLRACEREGLAFITWFPLGRGSLTQRQRTLDEVARAHGATRAQVALAWLLRRSPAILPIPGTSSIAHLEDNVATHALQLSDDDMALLADYRPGLTQLARRSARRLARALIDRVAAPR